MGVFFRLLLLTAFLWVGYILYSEAREQAKLDQPDSSKVALLFGGALLDGLVIAGIAAFTLVPLMGQAVGSFFFNPDAKIEHDPHSDAIAKLAQGDPEGAIGVYEAMIAKDPSNTLAISEIARICCRDLGDTPRAAAVIERALQSEWSPDQASFLGNRLADIYLLQGDTMRARQLVLQIAQNLDGTKFSANAQHRLREIDRALETGARAPNSLTDRPEGDSSLPSEE
jgi:tetratricopeptide (TPR) repeat protein